MQKQYRWNGRISFGSLISFRAIGLVFLIYFTACTAKYPPLEKTFRFAWENMPRTIDPRYSVDADSQYLGDFVHCSLVSFDPHGEIQNQVASEMQWTNPTTLEVTLRNGIQFSNGKEVSASDVKSIFEFLKGDPADPTPKKSNFSDLAQIEVLGSKKIRFRLSKPNGEFLYSLSIGLLPQEQAAGPRIGDPKEIIGCGEFKIDEWAVDHIQLKRRIKNPKSDVEYVRIEIVKDENTRFLKLRNSELDLVQNSINRDQLTRIHQFPHLKLMRRPGLNTSYLAFQYSDSILRNKKVRWAIAHAIDRQKMIDHLFHRWATPAVTILLPTDPYLNTKLDQIEFNPKLSQRLLDEAGFPMRGKNQTDPRFSLKLRTTPPRMPVAHAIADDLSKVGILLEIEVSDWGKFKSDIDKGNAQLWILNWIGFRGPDIYRFAFSTESIPPKGANRGRVSNSKLDALLIRGSQEIAFSKRKIIYDKVQEIVQDEMPYIFLWHDQQYAILNSRVKNYELYVDGSLRAIENVIFDSKKISD